MALLAAWALHPTEVRADLQRYYNLNIERMGTDFSCWQAAACVCCLPMGSSLIAAENEQATYSMEELLLHGIRDLLAHEHLPYPWEEAPTRAIADFGSMTVEEYEAWKKKKWRDTSGSHT